MGCAAAGEAPVLLSQLRQPPFLFGQPGEAFWPTNPPRCAPAARTFPSRSAGSRPCPEPPGGLSTSLPWLSRATTGPPVPAGCSPSPRLPGAAVRSAPGSGHLVTCREDGAGPGAAPSFSAPGRRAEPAGSGPGHRAPGPERDGLGVAAGPGAAGGRSIQDPGGPQLPPSPASTGAATATPRAGRSPGPRWDPEGKDVAAPGGSRCNPPTPARTHRAEPREPPGRSPLPPAPGTVRVPAAIAASAAAGPPPARLRLPPARGGPGPARPRRLLPTAPRETSAGPRARPPSIPDGPAPIFPISAAFFPRTARGSFLRGSCQNRTRPMEFKLFFLVVFKLFSPSLETTSKDPGES